MTEIDDMADIADYVQKAHEIAFKHGFWEVDKEPNFAEKIMLIVTELAECVQEDRQDKRVDEEIADVFIRLFDLCGYMFPNIEHEIKKKMKINENRSYKHNRKY